MDPDLDPVTDQAAPGQPRGFRADIGAAVSVWRPHPCLPVLSIGLATLAAAALHAGLAGPLLVLPLSLFAGGFYGTERLWYVRAYRGQSMDAATVWRTPWRFLGRFVRLGLLLGLIIAPAYIAIGIIAVRQHATAQTLRHLPLWAFVMTALLTLAYDVVATFMTPALALSTPSATEAFRLGWRVLRRTWPAAAPYAFLPPLAVILFFRLVPPDAVPATVAVALTALAAAVNLAAKGAVVRFYLREVDPRVTEMGSLVVDMPPKHLREAHRNVVGNDFYGGHDQSPY